MDDDFEVSELDSLVARTVWGYVIVIDTQSGESYFMGHNHQRKPVPNYGTDISAAYEVVEQMRHAHGFDMKLQNVVEGGQSKWLCAFTKNDKRRYIPVLSLSMPEAICLAAVQALQGKNIAQ